MAINTHEEIHNLVICVNIIVKRNDKFLMIRRSLEKKFLPGYVQPVGGKVESNEDPLTAVKRELQEEANITVKDVQLKAVVTEVKTSRDNIYQSNWQIFHFLGDYEKGSPSSSEEGELIWLTNKEIKQEKISDSIKILLDDLVSPEKKVAFVKYTHGEENQILDTSITYA